MQILRNPHRIDACTFCGCGGSDVLALIAGPKGTLICDICVADCVRILRSLDAKRLSDSEANGDFS